MLFYKISYYDLTQIHYSTMINVYNNLLPEFWYVDIIEMKESRKDMPKGFYILPILSAQRIV